MLDGKDALTHVNRKNDALRKSGYSVKMHAMAWRLIMRTTTTLLTFEHSRAKGARVDEHALVRTHVVLGRALAPIEEWKNCTKQVTNRKDLSYYSAKQDVIRLKDVIKRLVKEEKVISSHEETATNDEESEPKRKKQKKSNHYLDPKKVGMTVALQNLRKAKKKAAQEKAAAQNNPISSDSNKKTMAEIQSAEGRREVIENLVRMSPQHCAGEFLQQLQSLEGLHQSYENGRLA